jgi:hypothetical protein
MDGRWCRLSVVVAATLGAAYAYLLLLRAGAAFGLPGGSSAAEPLTRAQRNAYPLFVIATGLGSTTIFMASRTFPHHEAPAWGAALALGSFYHLMTYTVRPVALGHLVAAAALAFASFFSRATVGAGPLLALALLAANVVACRFHRPGASPLAAALAPALAPFRALCRWSGPAATAPPARAALVAAAAVMISAATYVAVNYAKFRTFFDGAPLRLHEQTASDPERMRRIGGKLMSAGNVRMNAYNYFAPDRIAFSRNFPWVYMTQELTVFPESKLDKVEPYGSLPASAPLLVGLSIIGFLSSRRPLSLAGADLQPGQNPAATPTIPMIGASAGALALLPVNYVSHRYLHDFFPLLVLAGVFGSHAVLTLRPALPRRLALGAVAIAFVFSVYVNCAFAITYQRVLVWGVARDRRIAFWHVRSTMDKHVSRAIWPDVKLPNPP